DLEALSIAGVPVYAERGPGGGCDLLNGYQTDLTGLNEAEVRALFLRGIASPLADLGLGQALDEAMLKLSAALPATQRHDAEQMRQRVHLDATWWHHTAEPLPHLETLQAALWQESKLLLTYREGRGPCSEQLVEPYGLVAKASVWYLVGAATGTRNVYRVSRIQAVIVTEECFTRPADFDLSLYWTRYCSNLEASQPSYAVPLRVAPDDVSLLPQVHNYWPELYLQKNRPVVEALARPEEKKAFIASQPASGAVLPYIKKQKMKSQFKEKNAPSLTHIKKSNFSKPYKKTDFRIALFNLPVPFQAACPC
ncbi:MAG: WYL domain-containing protein, partial [Chloroflexota bacterium]|nr:WYL domain-containing protein [Chloroflexota bacterium]